MENLQAFLNPAPIENLKGVVSDRFVDGSGKPIEWEFRAVSLDENRQMNTASVGKDGVFNMQGYKERLVAASVVYPDLQDAELQKGLGTIGDETATLRALLPVLGEFAAAFTLASKVNGLAEEPKKELEEAKNE